MSGFERSPASRALDALVSEAKEHLDVREEPDWSALEARVMAAVEKEKPALLRDVEESGTRRLAWPAASERVEGGPLPRRRDIVLRAGAILLASAAAVALFVRNDRDVRVAPLVREASGDGASASALRSTEGAGEVRINKVPVAPGYVVRGGDSIDLVGVRAVFERGRKVTWLLESQALVKGSDSARAHVKVAGEPLVLGLEDGVIEAQVAPVPVGEAFGVDVSTDHGVVRVAVHGTHLRVARSGDHVTVDLTEGVVSIGVPPRTGVTYGTIVTAPAHVELDATDLRTLRVDHAPASVRAAVPLGPRDPVVIDHSEPVAAPLPLSAPPAPGPSATVGHGAVARPAEITATAAKAEPPKPKVPPRKAIAAAVRECAATIARPGDVHVTVTSDLRLRVSGAGEVESAQFSPPLLPDIQSCAAQVIYRTKLEEAGTVVVPIEFSY
jgi:hypothetical protein